MLDEIGVLDVLGGLGAVDVLGLVGIDVVEGCAAAGGGLDVPHDVANEAATAKSSRLADARPTTLVISVTTHSRVLKCIILQGEPCWSRMRIGAYRDCETDTAVLRAELLKSVDICDVASGLGIDGREGRCDLDGSMLTDGYAGLALSLSPVRANSEVPRGLNLGDLQGPASLRRLRRP